MSTVAQTNMDAKPTRFSVRAYLAGGTATTALIAGVVVIFASLAAYVAFEGVPGGGEGPTGDSATLVGTPGAPEAAAVVVRRASAAVEATAAAPTATAPAQGATAPPQGATAPSQTSTSPTPSSGGGVEQVSAPQSESGEATGPAPSEGSAVDGPIDAAVTGLQDTAADLGADVPLGNLQNITEPVDQTVNNTLNNVGGALGDPTLGDQVTGTVNDTVTDTGTATDTVTDTVTGATSDLLGGN
jgi:hypothetical protein